MIYYNNIHRINVIWIRSWSSLLQLLHGLFIFNQRGNHFSLSIQKIGLRLLLLILIQLIISGTNLNAVTFLISSFQRHVLIHVFLQRFLFFLRSLSFILLLILSKFSEIKAQSVLFRGSVIEFLIDVFQIQTLLINLEWFRFGIDL